MNQKTGLTGQVISASDVSGQPDLPLANQLVFAVNLEQAGNVLGVREDQLTNKNLRYLKAQIPQKDLAITATLSDSNGNYTLLLTPGEYVVCVADSEKTPPDFPAATRGCGQTTVKQGEIRHVDISSGYGEILLVEKD